MLLETDGLLKHVEDLPAPRMISIDYSDIHGMGGNHQPVNVVKTRINHPIFGGLYHLFLVTWRIVRYCFNHMKCVFLDVN